MKLTYSGYPFRLIPALLASSEVTTTVNWKLFLQLGYLLEETRNYTVCASNTNDVILGMHCNSLRSWLLAECLQLLPATVLFLR